ncbi:hypothetical protein AGMMS50268_38730 [Spirochaetia bacterium]|nr:hypothetical protein AGMMS50268_38730 [Spirochaetia bacterium]
MKKNLVLLGAVFALVMAGILFSCEQLTGPGQFGWIDRTKGAGSSVDSSGGPGSSAPRLLGSSALQPLVTALWAAAGNRQVYLNWVEPGGSDFDHTEITWGVEDGTPATSYNFAKGVAQPVIITSLQNATEYTFAAVVVGASGAKSEPATAKVTPHAGPWTVTFVYQDGSTGNFDITGIADSTTVTAPAAPVWIEHFFGGWWQTSNAAAGTEWNFSGDAVTRDTYLYAKWIQTDEQKIRSTVTAAAGQPWTVKSVSIGGIKLLSGTVNPGTVPGPTALVNALYDQIGKSPGMEFNVDLTYCTEITDWNNNDYTDSGGYIDTGKAKVTGLIFPDSVTGTIDGFKDNTAIKAVKGNGVTNIAYEAFRSSGLTSVEFPRVTTFITQKVGSFDVNYAFRGCADLTNVRFDVLTKIPDGAFHGSTELISLYFPKATQIGWAGTSSGEGLFEGCAKLLNVSFPEATTIGFKAFAGCTGLATVSFPKVTRIGRGPNYDSQAFAGCTSLLNVHIPKVTFIGMKSFNGCTALKNIFLGDTPPTFDPVYSGYQEPSVIGTGNPGNIIVNVPNGTCAASHYGLTGSHSVKDHYTSATAEWIYDPDGSTIPTTFTQSWLDYANTDPYYDDSFFAGRLASSIVTY